MIENFFATAYMSEANSNDRGFEVKRVLIDGGAMVNMMTKGMADMAGFTITPDNSLQVRAYDMSTRVMLGYCRLKITVAGVRRELVVFIIPGILKAIHCY